MQRTLEQTLTNDTELISCNGKKRYHKNEKGTEGRTAKKSCRNMAYHTQSFGNDFI